MSFESFIGFRYLMSKRKQTFISVITFISVTGIVVGVMALIIVLSVMTGFEEDLKDKILGVTSHVVVAEYGGTMTDYEIVAETASGVSGVVGATFFTYNQAMISVPSTEYGGGGVSGVVVRGVDPDSAGDVTVLPDRIVRGEFEDLKIEFGNSEGLLPGILIGRELSVSIGAGLGDEVSVISPTGGTSGISGVPRMAKFKVVGIFQFGMYEYDASLAFMSVKNSQKFFQMGDVVTGVELKIEDIYSADEVSEDLHSVLGSSYYTRTWIDMNRNLFSALKLEKTAMFIILSLIIIVAALNIISTLIMVVMEKGKDIAILKSLGATSGSIMKIFMLEGIVIGFVGTMLGTFFGVVVAINLGDIVTAIENKFNFKVLPPEVYYLDRLPSEVDPMAVTLIALVSLSISFLATLYPSWQASKNDPVDGLRYE